MVQQIIMKKSYILKKCQVSRSNKLKKILDLGYQPAVNNTSKIYARSDKQIYYPTELFYCNKSKLFQLGYVVDKNILFPKSYPYTSSTTKILRENFKDLYNKTIKRFNLSKNDLVIDIGSNDGNLLDNFKNSCEVLGITPEKIGKLAIKKGIRTLIRYFDNKTVEIINRKFRQAKIITATNVFAHIDNPNNLTKNIFKCLDKDGIFISESHYFLSLIKTLQFDTIYHEHLRYYTIQSLDYLLKKNQFKIFDAEIINTHGGSIRVYAQKGNKFKSTLRLKKLFNNEKKYLKPKIINNFVTKVRKSKIEILKQLTKIKNNNKIIYAAGAPSRASTLINFLGIDSNIIDCVLEIKGSYKIGNYMPGTDIPIVDEKIIKNQKPNYILILSWHISDEIIKSLKKKGYKGKFIIPLPKPIII
jgi:2-polyprenyl-3-methyl-5-hydroxy-6-metoxy-1,4-benzoquinol methylase